MTIKTGTIFRSALAASIVSLAAASSAAPPPPVPTSPELELPIDGYDMRPVRQRWRYWVERQKGPVTLALAKGPRFHEGVRRSGAIFSFEKGNDFGFYLAGEMTSYCSSNDEDRVGTLENCHYVLRRAYIPLPAEGFRNPNPVSDWTQENFDPYALAKHFRETGVEPDIDWWFADMEQLFASAPSASEILSENAVVISLDSQECPEMGEAILALEGRVIDEKIDLRGIGLDERMRPPAPHATQTRYTLAARGVGRSLTLTGWRGPVEKMLAPILSAADKCEKARQ